MSEKYHISEAGFHPENILIAGPALILFGLIMMWWSSRNDKKD